ncbi:MAG: lytic transglycosylase domain-containing protein [Saprospiraceae bacterium]
MKRLFIVTITLVSITLTQAKEHSDARLSEATEQLIDRNLPNLEFKAPASCTAQIKKLIIRDIVNGKRDTEVTLGRSSLYFPIFEHFLRKYDLPAELKYIPYVETRLKPRAISPVGATGLWQFMSYTAQRYHLRTNSLVDDRYDPIRATEAATRFLQDLYVEFDDWLLALAAYNCGSGRVQRAIRLSKSRDYWKLRRYLPVQTQQYIPRFIAAAYIGEFHKEHNLKPKHYVFNFKNIKVLKIRQNQSVRLSDLAKVTDLPITTVRMLNPAYIEGVVPVNQRGNYLIFPAATIARVQRYLSKVNGRGVQEIKLVPIIPIAEVPVQPSSSSGNTMLYVPAERDSQQVWAWWAYAERFFDEHRWFAALTLEERLS